MAKYSYEEAEMIMAELLVHRSELEEQLVKDHYAQSLEDDTDHAALEEDILDELADIVQRTNLLGAELASDPSFENKLVCWMIRIGGDCVLADDTIEELENIHNDEKQWDKLNDYIQRAGGNLATKAYKTLQALGTPLVYSRLCSHGWCFGVLCDEDQAKKVCAKFHSNFEAAIESNLLKIQKTFQSWRLKTVKNLEDAEKVVGAESDTTEEST